MITSTSTGGPAPLHVTFGAGLMGGVPPYEFNWSFGDGSYANTSNPQHTFLDLGNYTIALTVTDSGGRRASDSIHLQVIAPISPICCEERTNSNSPWYQVWATELALGLGVAVVVIALAVYGFRRRPPEGSSEEPGPSPASSPEPILDTEAGPPTPADPPVLLQPQAVVPPAIDPLASEPLEAPAASSPSPSALPTAPPSRPLSDQVLVQLFRLGRPDPNAAVPPGFTQEGLALALGRPQSAFARSLLRLEEAGLISVQVAHVQGRRRRLKVYGLTPQGESAVRRLGESRADVTEARP
jgi:DNA-binding MarR family transcriptional regulator